MEARRSRARRRSSRRRRNEASGADRASPNARTGVPQQRSEGGARGRTNRRMAHALGRNSRGGARAPMATAVLYACRARARERGLRGANGSEGGGGRGRALLVADRDASPLPHARHAAARLCGAPRRHGAAVRARTRARARERGERGRAGPASASGPEVRPRPASAPFPFSIFFEFLFSNSFLNSF